MKASKNSTTFTFPSSVAESWLKSPIRILKLEQRLDFSQNKVSKNKNKKREIFTSQKKFKKIKILNAIKDEISFCGWNESDLRVGLIWMPNES